MPTTKWKNHEIDDLYLVVSFMHEKIFDNEPASTLRRIAERLSASLGITDRVMPKRGFLVVKNRIK